MDAPDTELDWAPQALQASLQRRAPGLGVRVQREVDSTNTQLLERLRAGGGPLLLAAEAQTAGRGRNGSRWHSAPGDSLTFSVGLPYAPRDWSGLSLAVGAALADAIEPQPQRLQLKWPNDLWLADGASAWRKLGGILIETVAACGARACVVGVGLNVRPLAAGPELASGYACVQELAPALDAPKLLARVAPPLLDALLRFERDGLPAFADAFARRDLLRGQAVATTHAAAPEGVAEGIDAQGALQVRATHGVVAVASGEVSVRPRAMVGV